MVKPNLLLCFDAFGTLFRPKAPAPQQYAEVARQLGIVGFTDSELLTTLKAAIKNESAKNPNYGKATGLGATQWWTNVIHNTFTPFLKNDHVLPKGLAPKLLHRFSSNEGYDTEPNLAMTLKALKQQHAQGRYGRIVVGVVTNSDDRVPSILSSFGLKVSPLRYGTDFDANTVVRWDYDIDFHCMSYDAGVEKPDKLIFNAAELMLAQIIAMRDGKSPAEAKASIESWRKVYVGDEYAKDVVGSRQAGWHSVLLDADNQSTNIPNLKDHSAKTIDGLFNDHSVVRVRSIRELTTWLLGENQATA
ncbi:hypothetical protein B0T10DRAFT_262316 [Thelonectria olida]|uniref:Haloacid dehalogenase n=1 Tax=Thelonectria olida TaxID=1576542 RepID=A0A9P8W8U2_9HYPO|nr:hypothetical protein B0T10DRAFT_262316 [Thelonectria olida]